MQRPQFVNNFLGYWAVLPYGEALWLHTASKGIWAQASLYVPASLISGAASVHIYGSEMCVMIFRGQHEKLLVVVPPGVDLICSLGNFPYLLSMPALSAHLVAHDLLPVCSGDHGVSGHQHLYHHEMLLRGIGPDLTSVEVAKVQPATILAVRA
jgi:hypothetical protein